MVQMVTWNDFGESSSIEPTLEFGDKFLRISAAAITTLRGHDGPPDLRGLDACPRLYQLRKSPQAEALRAALDHAAAQIADGHFAAAMQQLAVLG
jgi:hypothetical protein